jgi:hypothetical protein
LEPHGGGDPEFTESIPSQKGGVDRKEDWEVGDTYLRQDTEGNWWKSTLKEKNGQKVWETKLDNVTTTSECKVTVERKISKPKIISHYEWGARPPVGDDYTPVKNPVEFYTHIAIHHSGSTNSPSVNDVQNKHINKGFHDIGYHFAVDLEGNIYEGRAINKMGAGAGPADLKTGIIHIVILGDLQSEGFWEWSNDELTEEAVQSVVKLTQYLVKKYQIKYIGGHQDVRCNHTECPGNQATDRMNEIIQQCGVESADCLNTDD